MFQPIVRRLGCQPYKETWEAMRTMTLQRNELTSDEIWLVEHPSVFTQGRVGKAQHIRDTQNIPVVWSDRGGQVTYHGLGQIVVYLLLNLHRLNLGIRSLVNRLEESIIQTLYILSIPAHTLADAPGVYVNQSKIASIGLRIRKGFTYHGLAFNFHMDLTPFSYIDPCGQKNMKITQLYDLLGDRMPPKSQVESYILSSLIEKLSNKSHCERSAAIQT